MRSVRGVNGERVAPSLPVLGAPKLGKVVEHDQFPAFVELVDRGIGDIPAGPTTGRTSAVFTSTATVKVVPGAGARSS